MAPIRVLVVDDNPTFLDIAIEFLQQYDELNIIGTASGGRQALAQAQELCPQVILLDLAMPDLLGLEVIPLLQAMLPGVSIIILTLLNTDGCREAALTAGADDFVPKTKMNTDLLPAIQRVVQARLAQGKKS